MLEVDDFRDVTRSASVAYPRRVATGALAEQLQRTIVASESTFAAFDAPSAPDGYRASVPVEARSYELLGVPGGAPIDLEALRGAVASAIRDVPEAASPAEGVVRLRLLAAERTIYAGDDGTSARMLGDCGPRALVHEIQAAAFSVGQRATIYGDDVDDATLVAGGYVRDDGLWWARSARASYDPTRFFLTAAVFDPFGDAPTTIAYDDHALFAVAITDALGNVVAATHDYRVLAPALLTDANGNRTAAGFDTRGMVIWTAVMGKPGAGEGDTVDDPTTRFTYDPFAWRDRGEPNYAHVFAREQHGDPDSRWLERRVYSDGSGQVILEKASAEPGLAPQRDAGGQLVLAGDATVDAVVDPRWIGSGRTVFDNKGNVVRQYEPYFSATIAYETEAELRERGVTAVMHYDPLGRVERTEFPDGTLARIERTPWFERRFDGNDTVFEGRWHAERIGLPGVDAEELAQRRAAVLTESHADTPSIVHFDALGRAVRAIEDAGALGSFETRLELDVVGNVQRVIDARGNVAEARTFGLLRQVLQTEAADVGWRRALFDAGGSVLRGWNARGLTTRIAYDVLRRATHRFVTPAAGAEMLVVRTVWGEGVPNAADDNLRTRPYRVYDGSGELTNVRHDFAGRLVVQRRRLARVFDATVDWGVLGPAAAPEELAGLAEDALSSEVFEIAMRYDALGRVVSRTTPDRSETRMTYNAAGLLETIDVRVRGAEAATVIVGALEYDARGQRLRCEHGNGTVATYAYEPDTFRLSRMRLVRTSDAAVLQDLRYTYDPVGNIVQIRDGARADVVFANAVVSADQLFAYDAVYRLLSATGREMRSLSQPTDADVVFRSVPDHNDPDALRTYTEQYLWDEVGNLRSLQHAAGGGDGFTRQYVYAADGNRLLRTSAPGQSAEPFTHSYTHDVHGNMTSMPHLAAMDWDHADRLEHSDLGGGGQVWFVYDASGERVRKVRVNAAGARITERIYLGGYELYRERAVGSEVVDRERQTLHVDDERGQVCLVETLVVDAGVEVEAPANVARYQHGNHLGSVALELDGAGRVISYEEFHPFGTTSYAANDSSIEVSAKRYRYIGKERDDETGLYHLGARYYAAWLGRWTAGDPSGLADGVNRFAYCRGSPVTFRDIDGDRTVSPPQGGTPGGPNTPKFVSDALAADFPEAPPGFFAGLAPGEVRVDTTRGPGGRDLVHVARNTGTMTSGASFRLLPTDPQYFVDRGDDSKLAAFKADIFASINERKVQLVRKGFAPDLADKMIARADTAAVGLLVGAFASMVGGTGALAGVQAVRNMSSAAPLKNRSGNLDDAARARRTAAGASADPAAAAPGSATGRRGTAPSTGGAADGGSYRGVEIVDDGGSPIGEFDRIAGGVLIEEKSAAGLSMIPPGKTTPVQSATQWAERQIFSKTEARIQSLGSAAGTRATVGGTAEVPSLAEVRSLRTLEFHIDADNAALRSAVEGQLQRLREAFPDWTFRARFGGQ